MRVLLYETGQIGHRPVYREYYKSALKQVGVSVEVHCEPDYKSLFGFNQYLQALAAERECDLVHILTLDDHTKRMFASRSSPAACPTIGTYYLYQNISHAYKGWAIERLFKLGKVNALIVPSSMEIVSPKTLAGTHCTIFPLPDPIENNANLNIPKQKARTDLQLPSKWIKDIIILYFGALDKRRGLHDVIRMLKSNSANLSGKRFIFAGKIDHKCLSGKDVRSLVELTEKGIVYVIDRWLTSAEVANVFASSDLFLSMNEKRFQGASSTLGRAVNAGLAIVAPEDTVAGMCAKVCGRAELFRRGDAGDFVQSIRKASAMVSNERPPLAKNVIPLTIDITEFGNRLVGIYHKIR